MKKHMTIHTNNSARRDGNSKTSSILVIFTNRLAGEEEEEYTSVLSSNDVTGAGECVFVSDGASSGRKENSLQRIRRGRERERVKTSEFLR